jgi:hypothetical protein
MTPGQHNALKLIMWDYDISVQEMESLISGNTPKAGHYTRETLFIKMASGLPWFTLLDIFGAEKIKELLTDDVIKRIWPESIQKKYRYVRKRLHEALPDSK